MDSTTQNAEHLPTVKCSTCAASIDLFAVAEHVCSTAIPMAPSQPSHAAPFDSYNYANVLVLPVDEHVPVTASQSPFMHRPRKASLPKINRPVLPKLDSSVTSRSGLRPSEAASIAADLGLPSPRSAGSSHRSRSRSRKANLPRPPSTDSPISQDCAFPPFPMKIKKPTVDKDTKTERLHSASRSGTSIKKYEHSATPSTSSSVYSSSSSGPSKRRTSNTSSSQRSRHGMRDDSISLTSTAPSSPRQSVTSPLSRQQSIDQTQQMPELVFSHSNTSEPNSSISSMPSTPSWPLEPSEPSPRILQTSNFDIGWTPTESTIPEEQLPETEVPTIKIEPSKVALSDGTIMSQQLQTGDNMFDNPPREPLYKSKRPAPLLQPQRNVTQDPAMPLSARPPPPSASSSTGSITRTISNLFGRKRSQSTVTKGMPLPSFDSPRMRALAPDPPERPSRGEGLWDTDEPMDNLSVHIPTPATSNTQEVSTLHDTPSDDDQLTALERKSHNNHNTHIKSAESVDFDFKFNDTKSPDAVSVRENEVPEEAVAVTQETSTDSGISQLAHDLRRASIDSASSYGSIGFSNHSKSSRSSPPCSEEIPHTIAAVLNGNSAPNNVNDMNTTNIVIPPRPELGVFDLDSPTDPLYSAGKLSPVPEPEHRQWPQSAESGKLPPQLSTIPPPEPTPKGSPKRVRPVTPAGIKGQCRGCLNVILVGQKSVASADGRLTGRYHKECFSCETCKESFATADFYVFDDKPYCAYHYHLVNDTLCVGCGKGIEGQYLETFDVTGNKSKKFHAKCLQCATCKLQLNDDYFEYQGRVYCEKDAFRAASSPRSPYDTIPSRPSPLVREYITSGESGLKGRFPERRTTRLIMT